MAHEATGRRTSWDAEATFLTRRPKLGRAWVVDMAGTSNAERLCLRTLQGTLNRTEARLYLVNSDSESFGEGERFWIDEYERRGWVEVAGQLSMAEALAHFAGMVDGYVVATEAEPWTIHAATVIATLHNGVVAPDAVADRLREAGWRELDDVRGRWPDALSAYRASVDAHRDQLAYPGMALLRHTENLWDFLVQQEIMPMFTRPKHDTWDGVAEILDSYPGGHILYGYVSDDGAEEGIAVERASSSGKYLVPTSQVSNLSFHVAVQGNSPLQPIAEGFYEAIGDFDPTQVNVAIAISDGDNLQVPIQQYPRSDFWATPERGTLPLGWSFGVSLSTLAPGIWEVYRSTARPNDEIVSIMGIAYVQAAALPDPGTYFADTFASMADMGLHTLWSLDSSLTITDDPLWDVLEAAPFRDALHGVVVGYSPSIDQAYRRSTGSPAPGTPVLITENVYSEDAARLKERIEALMAMDPAERSPVNFLMATNWNATAESLYETLKPLADQGVRFLTPAQALACVPQIEGIARRTIEGEAPPGMCMPKGSMERFGSANVSAPLLTGMGRPIPLPVQVVVEAPSVEAPGETITYTAVLTIDVTAPARDFHQSRVLPVIEGGELGEEYAKVAWTKLVASDIRVRLPLPAGITETRILGLDASGVEAGAEAGSDGVLVTLSGFTSDSRNALGRASEVTVHIAATQDIGAATDELAVGPESVAFDFALTVGLGPADGPFVGGVRGSMAGVGAQRLAATAVAGK